jgi:hypothetical protein
MQKKKAYILPHRIVTMQRKEREKKRKEEGRRRKKVLHGRVGSCRKDLARD